MDFIETFFNWRSKFIDVIFSFFFISKNHVHIFTLWCFSILPKSQMNLLFLVSYQTKHLLICRYILVFYFLFFPSSKIKKNCFDKTKKQKREGLIFFFFFLKAQLSKITGWSAKKWCKTPKELKPTSDLHLLSLQS